MAKRKGTIVKWLVALLVVAILVAAIPMLRNAVGGWFSGIFSSDKGDDTKQPAGDVTTDPTETTEPEATEPEATEPPVIDLSNTAIADLPEEQRLAGIQKKLEDIAARKAGDNQYTLEQAMLMTMTIGLNADGNVVVSGHNMPAPGTETYSMDSYPGGWNWVEVNGVAKVPMFISGHKISVLQSQVEVTNEYVPVDEQGIELALCKHANALLSGYFVRTRGDIAIVTFNSESFSGLKNAFVWWYETDANGNQVVKVGFNYCNGAPEGVEVIPIVTPSLGK